jgi:hypothetical protein
MLDALRNLVTAVPIHPGEGVKCKCSAIAIGKAREDAWSAKQSLEALASVFTARLPLFQPKSDEMMLCGRPGTLSAEQIFSKGVHKLELQLQL